MRFVLLIRCLPKMPPSSSTSPVHRLPVCHLEAILDMNNVATSAAIFYHRRRGRCSSDTGVSSPNPVPRDILPHRHSQLSDLTIRLYTTTSLKSVSLKRWLHHQMFKLSSDQFNSRVANHVTSHSSFSLVNRLTADVYRIEVIKKRIPLLWP